MRSRSGTELHSRGIPRLGDAPRMATPSLRGWRRWARPSNGRVEADLGEGLREPLFRLAGDLICTIGFDRRLEAVNPAFLRALGYGEAELVSRDLVELVHAA